MGWDSVLSDAGKREALSGLMAAVVEVGWGTGDNPSAQSLTNPVYVPVLRKAVEGNPPALVVEYAAVSAVPRVLREVALFGRSPSGQRVLLWRAVRTPLEIGPTLCIRDRIEIRIE